MLYFLILTEQLLKDEVSLEGVETLDQRIVN